MKKLYTILLAFILIFGMTGCGNKEPQDITSSSEEVNVEFAEFIDGLPAELLSTNALDLNYVFHDPSAYGVEKELGDVFPFTVSEYKEILEECEALLEKLESFDYATLTIEQQFDYVVLKDYLDRELLMKGYEYYENSYLGSYLGVQAQLPLVLVEFELHDKLDLETYLNTLKTAPEAFRGYVEVEKERQEKGVGMSQILIDGVIEQCVNFADGDVSFLIDEMNEKIDAATFLTEEEKIQAKADNESYTKNEFMQAYVILQEELAKIEPKEEDITIAHMENGKDYYEALFQNKCGFDWTIKELEKYLDEKEDEHMNSLKAKLRKNPKLQVSMFSQTYGEFASAEDNIDYLADVYTQYFPNAGTMNYRVVDVPVSMQENFSPAAYLTSRVDRKLEEPLLILINGGYSSNAFTTIAHEGYPGHMYQDCYFQQLDVSTFRYLIDCTGYNEGWATYVEGKTYWFTKNDNEEELMAFNDNQKIYYAMAAKWDIMINYHGVSREEFKKELELTLGVGTLSDEDINNQYTQLMENPTNYLMYFVNGLYFDDLYTKAEEALGDAFDPVAFHQVILDTGSAGMTVITNQVDNYIEANKK